MRVGSLQERDRSYAMALLPIIAHKDRQEVEIRPRGKSYLVFFDDKRRLLVIKKGKTQKRKVGLAWYFNVYPNEIEALSQAMHNDKKAYLHLVCGVATVCTLEGNEAIDLLGSGGSSLRVHYRNGIYTVTGPTGKQIDRRKSKRSDFLNYFFQ